MRTYPAVTVAPATDTLARINCEFTFATVACTVLEATAASAVPIAYHDNPLSSDPSSCRVGGVVAAPMLTTN